MKKLVYEEPEELEKREIEKMLASSNPVLVKKALLSIGLYGDDWKWSQEQCLFYLSHENIDIAGMAATCLGHVARIHRKLDKNKVALALEKAIFRKEISGRVNSAISDINIFIK